MKISCNILKRHIKNSDKIDWLKVWDTFTIRTAEVEGVEVVGNQFDGVVVAQITSCEDHPKSKKLHVLTVNNGTEDLQIVCGAPNVRVGLKVALIQIGGHIEDITIAKRPLVGIDSYGMCCSARELGISEDHEGLIELPDEFELGKDIKECIPEINDIIIEIDNKSLTNRPDLWGHYGIAREIAAITGCELIPLELSTINNELNDLDVKVLNSDVCSRYSAIKLDSVRNVATPLWMKIFLHYAGMRSISYIVDLTNYIMLELGQPLHAFDSRVVKNIEVGNAKDGDMFTTLDGVERKLTNTNLMIKNNNEYFAIAGVMGGLDSEILDDTSSLVLESACFEASSIRKTANYLGLRTEASARFEKSLDPNLTELALKRFIKLLKDEVPELSIASNMTDVYPNPVCEFDLNLNKRTLKRYMGKELSEKDVTNIFEALQFKVVVKDDCYVVTVPTYRATKDISMEADLVEEISRMYGYENFETEPLKLDLTFTEHENVYDSEYEAKRYLATKYSMNEVHTYLWYKSSFLKQINVEKSGVMLSAKNEDNVLRDDLCLSLVEVSKTNFKNFNALGIFELGTEIIDGVDCRSLSFLLGDEDSNIEKSYNKAKEIVTNLFFDLKNVLVSFEKDESYSYNVSDYSYKIVVDGVKVGELNIVHPRIINTFTKKKSVVTVNIDFKKFCAINNNVIRYKDVSKYPVVELDYTIIANKDVKYSTISDVVELFKNEYIIKHTLLDVYEGNNEKKYTIRYYVGSEEKTLSQEELDTFKEEFINTIKNNQLNIIE